jgi:putative acetyltransferase
MTPAARRQKVGDRIVEALELIAQNLGIGNLKLETGTERSAAIRMYEARGYHRRARFGGYPDDPLSIFMSKTLTVGGYETGPRPDGQQAGMKRILEGEQP